MEALRLPLYFVEDRAKEKEMVKICSKLSVEEPRSRVRRTCV